jgi:hypothetical protein
MILSAASARSTGGRAPRIVSDAAFIAAEWTALAAERADAAAEAVAAKAEELAAVLATAAAAGTAEESDLAPSEVLDCMPAGADSATGETAAVGPETEPESELPVV